MIPWYILAAESRIYRIACLSRLQESEKRIKANVADLFLKCTNRRSFLVPVFLVRQKSFVPDIFLFFLFFSLSDEELSIKSRESVSLLLLVPSLDSRPRSNNKLLYIYIYIPKHRPPKKPPRHSIHPSPTTRKANCITSCTFRSLR